MGVDNMSELASDNVEAVELAQLEESSANAELLFVYSVYSSDLTKNFSPSLTVI